MKVLVIGSKGMLGQELAKIFAKDHPLLWDRREVDIADFAQTRKKILAASPGVIVNAAAFNNVDKAEGDAERVMKINGEAVENLAQLADRCSAILVTYSSEYVFDGKKRTGYKEGDAVSPLSVYGKSKAKAEEGARKAKRHYIIRLSRLFGLPGGGKKSFVEKIIALSKTQSELEVVDEELSCPTYAPDLAARTKYILENKVPYGIYHAANSGSCTWYGLAKETFKITDIPVKLIPVESGEFARKAKRPKYGILLNTKLPPMRNWQEALEEFLASRN